MKKTSIAFLFLLSGVMLFAADKGVGDSATVNASFETIWGVDLNTGYTGFDKAVDIDFEWALGEWSDYSSDISEVSFSKPYGMAFISGGLINFRILDHQDARSGDRERDNIEDNRTKSASGFGDDLEIQIMFENAWSKIIFNPFYVLLEADIQNFDRQNGYNFEKNQDAIRANWAYIGSRIPLSYILDSNDWWKDGETDAIQNEVTNEGVKVADTAGVSLGYGGEKLKAAYSIGTQKNWETNEFNRYDMAFDIEVKPVNKLTLNASVVSGINYENFPVKFGVGSAYEFPLGYTNFNLQPFGGLDAYFSGQGDDAYKYMNTEVAYGVNFTWPGENGWGFEWLSDDDRNRYSGITLSGNTVTIEEETRNNLSITMFEDTVTGLIPDLGSSLLFEIKDLGSADQQLAYGAYVEYLFHGMARPFMKVESKSGDLDGDIAFSGGTEFLFIPNAGITAKYESQTINDTAADAGLVTVAVKIEL